MDIFAHDNLLFDIKAVLAFDQVDHRTRNWGRDFHSLSLRVSADTDIILQNETFHLTDKSVLFMPSGIDYIRDSRHDNMYAVDFQLLNAPTLTPTVYTPRRFDELHALFCGAFELWQTKGPGYRYRTSALVYEIFALLFDEQSPHGSMPPILEKPVTYMHKHYTDASLQIAELARMANMSEVYFRRLFHENFGTSPKKYLDRLRLEHAKTLLRAGYDSVADVAVKSGFDNVKYFSTAFKARTGRTPSVYAHTHILRTNDHADLPRV